MRNHGCINGTLAGDTYSSPVPIIGLYVAAASLVCMSMMAYDIVKGFVANKRWLPCKLFALNSVTLTLLSIATKLPVDLTTQMPSRQDQLSKLTGTSLVCIAMGFFAPSVGTSSKSESFGNMAALSIFVITIVVNICIEISTGVIVLFVAEHIIVLSCMLLLLMMLWIASSNIGYHKIISTSQNKRYLESIEGPMLRRLKYCQMFTYSTNPQFVACKLPSNSVIGALCLVSLVAIIQAAVRSLILKQLEFCDGNSDYDWSMVPIVVSQILTVMVGSFAINFRWMAMFLHTNFNLMADVKKLDDVIENSPILGKASTLGIYKNYLLMPYEKALFVLEYLVVSFPMMVIHRTLSSKREGSLHEEFLAVMDEWTVRKGTEDMERLRDAGTRQFPNQLFQLLSGASSSQQMDITELRYESVSLTIVLLVRLAQFLLPDKDSRSIVEAFVEVKELVHFIDKIVSPKNVESINKLDLAKAVWAGNDFSCLLPLQFTDDMTKFRMLFVSRGSILPKDSVTRELMIVLDFIKSIKSSSGKDLYTILEGTFVAMVHVVLAELPYAIIISLNESPAEEFEDRVRFALQLLFRLERFQEQIQWSFPEESDTIKLTRYPSAAMSGSFGQITEDVTDDISTHEDDVTVSHVNLFRGNDCDDVIIPVDK